jgi:hypothetical protein
VKRVFQKLASISLCFWLLGGPMFPLAVFAQRATTQSTTTSAPSVHHVWTGPSPNMSSFARFDHAGGMAAGHHAANMQHFMSRYHSGYPFSDICCKEIAGSSLCFFIIIKIKMKVKILCFIMAGINN